MPDQKLRKLDLLEKYHSTRHFLGLDACVVTSARYTSVEGTFLSEEILFPALKVVIHAHAALGVRFHGRDDSTDVAFLRLPRVDLRRIVEYSGSNNLAAVLEKQLSRRFEDTQGDLPLWRLEVMADNTVILAMHHAIGDGLSSAAFHYALYRALQEYQVLPSYSASVYVPDIPLLPGVIENVDARPSLYKKSSIIYEALVPKQWSKAYSAWTGHPVPVVAKIQSRVRLLKFAPSDVKPLSELCRAHNTTMSACLYELAVIVLSRLISKEPDAARYKTLHILVPVSVRHLVGMDSYAIGNFASSWQDYAALHTEFSWQNAAQVARELQIQKTKSQEMLGFLSWVDYSKWMPSLLGAKRVYSLIISNLGRSQAPEIQGEWKMSDLLFTQCDTLLGAAMGMNVVGDSEGGINISITWGAKSLDTAFVEEFISKFQEAFSSVLA